MPSLATVLASDEVWAPALVEYIRFEALVDLAKYRLTYKALTHRTRKEEIIAITSSSESSGLHSDALSPSHSFREACAHSGSVRNVDSLNRIVRQTSNTLACMNSLIPLAPPHSDGPIASIPFAVPWTICCSQPSPLLSLMSSRKLVVCLMRILLYRIIPQIDPYIASSRLQRLVALETAPGLDILSTQQRL